MKQPDNQPVVKLSYFQRNREACLAKRREWSRLHSDLVKERCKKYYQKNKEKLLLKQKQNRATTKWFENQNLEKKILAAARNRAKIKNIDFNITLEDIIIPEFCPVLGIKLFRSKGRKTGNSPSLDRFDNSKGYIKGNVRVISERANHLKNDATISELEAIIKYMKNE